MAKGDVIYTVREMKPSEHRLVAEQIKASHLRIIWQQFFDGFPTYRHYGVGILAMGRQCIFEGHCIISKQTLRFKEPLYKSLANVIKSS